MSEYIPIAVAAELASGGRAIDYGRHAVLVAITQQLLHARAYRAKITALKFEEAETGRIEEILSKNNSVGCIPTEWLSSTGEIGQMETHRTFEAIDAFSFLKAVDGSWAKSSGSEKSHSEIYADWSLGRFHSRWLRYRDRYWAGEDQVGYFYGESEWFGVEVEGEAVQRLLVPQGQSSVGNLESKELPAAITTFDWESAFSDVAAAFHFDVGFRDVGARGVQTEIVELLRSSFSRRGLIQPGETILKAKARKIQAALRAHKSE